MYVHVYIREMRVLRLEGGTSGGVVDFQDARPRGRYNGTWLFEACILDTSEALPRIFLLQVDAVDGCALECLLSDSLRSGRHVQYTIRTPLEVQAVQQ